ncbi:MAG: tetratricopeptide repeat protein [Pseudomonadota bacterium]
MSLLYKALNQASQLREKGSIKPETSATAPAGAAAAATVPLAERLMAQGFSPKGEQSSTMRIARLALFGLIGLSAIAIAVAILLPASPPEQFAAPTPPPVSPPAAEVAPANAPVPAEPAPEVAAQAPAANAPAADASPADASIAEVAESLAETLDAETAEMAAAPTPLTPPPAAAATPERIGASPDPAETQPRQKRVRDGGLENFVEEQVAREAASGLGPPITMDRTGAGAIGQRSPVEITDDTEIVREKYESAALMLQRDQPEESLFIYNQLLRNNPRDRIALLGRAASLQKLGRTLMAVSAYEDVLAAFPGDEWALVNLLGLVSQQEPARALAQLERLQRLNPKTALLPAQIGMIQMAQGNFEMAARSLEKATLLDPDNAKYVFNLAVLFDKWGQPQAALRYYRRCLEMAQNNPDGQIPLETVRSRMTFLDVK